MHVKQRGEMDGGCASRYLQKVEIEFRSFTVNIIWEG